MENIDNKTDLYTMGATLLSYVARQIQSQPARVAVASTVSPKDLCDTIQSTYVVEDKAYNGLDELQSGDVVKAVDLPSAHDSGRFKREALTSRLDEEESRSLDLYADTPDLGKHYVLSETGISYEANRPCQGLEGTISISPVPTSHRKLSREEKRALIASYC